MSRVRGSNTAPELRVRRLLHRHGYLRRYRGVLIDGEELMVVSGIGEWARRVRELRVEKGWPILTGVTVAELTESLKEEGAPEDAMPRPMRPDQYLLERDEPDLEAAAMRISSPLNQNVSPSTTQLVPPPTWQYPKLALTGVVLARKLETDPLKLKNATPANTGRSTKVAGMPLGFLLRRLGCWTRWECRRAANLNFSSLLRAS